MTLVLVLGVDENIIQIYNNNDIKLPGQNFINMALKACRYIE